jgi:hypothetical protein
MTLVSDVRYSLSASSGPEQPELELSLPAGMHYGGSVPPALVPQPINLVRSSRTPTDPSDVRWTSGFSYMPSEIGNLDILDDCGPDASSVGYQKAVKVADWHPYVLSAEFQCSMMGFDEAAYQQRARDLLDVATPKMVEYEFWSGKLAKLTGWPNLYLEQASGADVYTASSVQEAVGICEMYIGAMGPGSRGMIHASPYLTPYLQLICRREGNLLLTYRDTIVVPGAGYGDYVTGSAPPQPTGTFKMFATGITDCRLGEIVPVPDKDSFYQAIDRSTNSVVVKAERYACASWDGYVFARVDLTLP